MKVSDLIAKLQDLDPDLQVMTPGFDESGLDLVKEIEVVSAVRVYEDGATPMHGATFDYEDRLNAWAKPAIGEPVSVLVINY